MRTSKLPDVGTTIFSVMSALAAKHNAVNLGQGFPSFPIDEAWGMLMKKYIETGKNQYAPMPGIPELRKVLAQKYSLFGSYDPEGEITITAGATQAIFTAIQAFVHPGDEVILFAPAYDCYAPAVTLAGGKVKWLYLSHPEYSIPWEKLEEAITEKTAMIVINHPHNPTGTSLNEGDMKQLAQMISGTDIVLLSDEVYEHILFDGKSHDSALKYPEIRNNVLSVFSFGKTFHMTGWKMGYAIADASLMNEFRKVHQFNVFSCNTPVQYALNEYLENPKNYLELSSFYQNKRDGFLKQIEHPKLKFLPCTGTYFVLADFSDMSDEKDTDIAIRWTKEHRLTTIPCSVFYPDGRDHKVVRMCFAKDDETMQQAAQIINNLTF